MLVELSVVEQRYQAVLAVIRDGVSIVQVAHRFGVSKRATTGRESAEADTGRTAASTPTTTVWLVRCHCNSALLRGREPRSD